MKLKSILINLLKIGFSAALIYWLIKSDRFDVKSLEPLFTWQTVPIGLLMVFFSLLLLAERWRVLLQIQGFQLSFVQVLKLSLVGIFFNYAMPGGVGGDVIKGFYVVRSQPHRKLDAAMTILMDRIFGLYIMVLLALASMLALLDQILAHPQLQFLVWIVALIFLIFTTALSLGFSTRIRKRVQTLIPDHPLLQKVLQIWDGVAIYRSAPRSLLKVGFLCLVAQFCTLGFYIYCGYMLGFSNIPISVYFVACLVGTMMSALPITPAGIGVGQAAFAFLFSELTGHATTLGATLATAGQAYWFIWGLVGSVVYLGLKSEKAAPAVTNP